MVAKRIAQTTSANCWFFGQGSGYLSLGQNDILLAAYSGRIKGSKKHLPYTDEPQGPRVHLIPLRQTVRFDTALDHERVLATAKPVHSSRTPLTDEAGT